MSRGDEVWKNNSLAQAFLDGVRGAIPLAGEQIEVMLRLIKARDESVTSFADLGCGNGILAKAILAQYPQARGTLVDFSEPMLREAQIQLKNHPAELHFIIADLGLEDWVCTLSNQAPFDVIVSGFAIHHQPDERKRQLYREIFTLLKPGGIFVNLEHVTSRTSWITSIFDDLFVDNLFAYHEKQQGGQLLTLSAVKANPGPVVPSHYIETVLNLYITVTQYLDSGLLQIPDHFFSMTADVLMIA